MNYGLIIAWLAFSLFDQINMFLPEFLAGNSFIYGSYHEIQYSSEAILFYSLYIER